MASSRVCVSEDAACNKAATRGIYLCIHRAIFVSVDTPMNQDETLQPKRNSPMSQLERRP